MSLWSGAFSQGVDAKAVSLTENDSPKINTEKPGVYIEFEKYGKRIPLRSGESDEGVWLRLVNNLKFPIRFCTFGISSDGQKLIASKGTAEIGVKYDVERTIRGNPNVSNFPVPIGYNTGSSCHKRNVKSGGSLIFSVPKEHLADGLSIRLPFEFAWESLFPGEPEHLVRFHSVALPKP
jgi:hypothetical protein